MTLMDDALVGILVGCLDVALLWPFVVIACRREAGAPTVISAIRQGKLWAGGLGGLTLLVPYCVGVEALSNSAFRREKRIKNEDVTVLDKLRTVPGTSFLIALGQQPIEKKIVMDTLFQSEKSGKGPVFDLIRYAKSKGISRLMLSGFLPLWMRETIYVSAVTVLNPLMTSSSPQSMVFNSLSAFAIGFAAGMISAPLQTLNVMQKDERNVGKPLRELIFPREGFSLKRMFFGSGSRSLRTGAAGVLWYVSRSNVAYIHSSLFGSELQQTSNS